MIDQTEQVDAIFLIARHGRAAPNVAGTHCAQAADRGDATERRRWRNVRRLICRTLPG